MASQQGWLPNVARETTAVISALALGLLRPNQRTQIQADRFAPEVLIGRLLLASILRRASIHP
jgi:hypothetical protein